MKRSLSPPPMSPWTRGRVDRFGSFDIGCHSHAAFHAFIDENMGLDIATKRAALKIAPYIVSITSGTGEKMMSMGVGTIIGSENVNGTYLSTILTSATVIRSCGDVNAMSDDIKVVVHLQDGTRYDGQVYSLDYHYNIAFIDIKSNEQIPFVCIRLLDDSISIDPSSTAREGVVRPHSDFCRICPGDKLIAIGRFRSAPYGLMAAPGEFSLDRCNFDCKELFKATCKISKSGIGGPVINMDGEVVGMSFYYSSYTPFLPINVAIKCLGHFKRFGTFPRPSLGMEMANLYSTDLHTLEKIILKFPSTFKGVIVEKVQSGSFADAAGICPNDVIVQCGGNPVRGFLEFIGFTLDKDGQSLELVLNRPDTGETLHVNLVANDTSPDLFNSWPVPEESKMSVGRLRRRV